MIKVYGYPNSRSTRVCWMLEELGQDYQFQLIDFAKGDSRSPEFLAVNPAGKVPAIQDGDLVLTESAAILAYLGDKFTGTGLVPRAGTAARAHYDQWSYFALSELEQPLWTLAKHKFALPKEQRVAEIFPTAAWEYQNALTLLSQGLGDKPYLLGDQFTGVDILMGQILGWGLHFEQPLEQANLQAYVQRINGRPAKARAQAREQDSQA